jgi:hypothetical protein
MFNNSNGYSLADIAAATGNGGNNNGGFGFNGDGAWILVLFILILAGGWGYGNGGFGGNGGASATVTADVQRGFDQSAVISGLSGISSAINTGFSNAEVSRCNSQANILQTLNNNQANLSTQLNTIAMNQQNCCCENRAAVLDSKYANAQEHCQDRYEAANNTRDIITNATGNTQMLLNTINNGIQSIQDKLCQQEIDALKSQNIALQNQLNMATLRESQTAQTAQILANNDSQTRALEQYLNPPPIPAYVVQNPNCCNQNAYNCGCGCN